MCVFKLICIAYILAVLSFIGATDTNTIFQIIPLSANFAWPFETNYYAFPDSFL